MNYNFIPKEEQFSLFLKEIKNININTIKEFNLRGDKLLQKNIGLKNYVENLIKALIFLFFITPKKEQQKELIKILKSKGITPYMFFKYQTHFLFTFPFFSSSLKIEEKNKLKIFTDKIIQVKQNIIANINTLKTENSYFEEISFSFLKKGFSYVGKLLFSIGQFVSFLFNSFNTFIDFLTAPLIKKLPGGSKTLSFLAKGVTSVIPLFFSLNLSPVTFILLNAFTFSRGIGRKIGNAGEIINNMKEIAKEIENAVNEINWEDADMDFETDSTSLKENI